MSALPRNLKGFWVNLKVLKLKNQHKMDYKTFLEKKLALTSQMDSLQKQVSELNQQYLLTSPFQRGDKVLVKSKAGYNNQDAETIVFIGEILLPYSFNQKSEFRYTFLKCKKDGAASSQSAGIYRYDSIEKIEP